MRNLTKHIGVRIPPKDFRLLKEVSRARGIDVSDFVRQVVRSELAKLSYLDDTAKKALGIPAGGQAGHVDGKAQIA